MDLLRSELWTQLDATSNESANLFRVHTPSRMETWPRPLAIGTSPSAQQAQSKTRKRAHANVHTTSLLLLLAHKSQTHASPHVFFFLVENMEKLLQGFDWAPRKDTGMVITFIMVDLKDPTSTANSTYCFLLTHSCCSETKQRFQNKGDVILIISFNHLKWLILGAQCLPFACPSMSHPPAQPVASTCEVHCNSATRIEATNS